MRLLFTIAGLGLLLGACSSGSMSLKERLAEGRMAFSQGQVLLAYKTLHKADVAESPELAEEYSQLLAQVTSATEHLVEIWLERIEYWKGQGDLAKALAYFSDLLNRLPEADPLRKLLQDKADPLRAHVAELRKKQDRFLDKALAAFSDQRINDSRTQLLEARWHARENHLEFPLQMERLLAECDRRLPPPDDEVFELVEESAAPEKVKPVTPVKRPSVRPRKTQPPEPEIEPKPLVPEKTFDAAAESLFHKAQLLVRNGRRVKAIVILRQVIERDENHAEAIETLKQLEPFRKAMIERWTRQASEHFAREELGKAAPYYRKILMLDPDNIRAKEGLQMHKRLRELKGRKKS